MLAEVPKVVRREAGRTYLNSSPKAGALKSFGVVYGRFGSGMTVVRMRAQIANWLCYNR